MVELRVALPNKNGAFMSEVLDPVQVFGADWKTSGALGDWARAALEADGVYTTENLDVTYHAT